MVLLKPIEPLLRPSWPGSLLISRTLLPTASREWEWGESPCWFGSRGSTYLHVMTLNLSIRGLIGTAGLRKRTCHAIAPLWVVWKPQDLAGLVFDPEPLQRGRGHVITTSVLLHILSLIPFRIVPSLWKIVFLMMGGAARVCEPRLWFISLRPHMTAGTVRVLGMYCGNNLDVVIQDMRFFLQLS